MVMTVIIIIIIMYYGLIKVYAGSTYIFKVKNRHAVELNEKRVFFSCECE